jgi:hypothetical protein
MAISLALMLCISNEKPFVYTVFFADQPVLWCNTYNFLKEVGSGKEWIAISQTFEPGPLLNLGELLT